MLYLTRPIFHSVLFPEVKRVVSTGVSVSSTSLRSPVVRCTLSKHLRKAEGVRTLRARGRCEAGGYSCERGGLATGVLQIIQFILLTHHCPSLVTYSSLVTMCLPRGTSRLTKNPCNSFKDDPCLRIIVYCLSVRLLILKLSFSISIWVYEWVMTYGKHLKEWVPHLLTIVD